jgi:hypothetical protein
LKDAETESAIKQKIFGYRVARSLLTSLLLPLQFFLKEPKLQPPAVPLRNYIMRVSLLATFVVAVTIAMFPVYTSGQLKPHTQRKLPITPALAAPEQKRAIARARETLMDPAQMDFPARVEPTYRNLAM